MKQFINHLYIKKDSIEISNGTLTAWQSTQSIDDQWDDFLASTPFGHFYQTSMWAEVRKLDGWQPLITVIALNVQIVGGFQILTRSKAYLGKIGLVLKGPVVASDDPVVINFIVAILKKTAQLQGIRALIIQPADRDDEMYERLKSCGLSANYLSSALKTNTLVVDLTKEEKDILIKMKGTKRRNIKTAQRMGAMVREGSQSELRIFFKYMLETCKRQGVKPSPSNERFLMRLWDLFSPSCKIKLFVTECEGKVASGYLVILFGDTAYLWKFGWSGEYSNHRPNDILYWEIFKWAKLNGYRYCDISAIDEEIANKLMYGEKISGNMSKTYSYFKVGFGGDVIPLSSGFFYIPNPVIRLGYELLMPFINARPSLKKRFLFGEQ
jgi:lipid II:glycine glycyltransferase (peptidoglycan interpeptide bridge formation enzyme)